MTKANTAKRRLLGSVTAVATTAIMGTAAFADEVFLRATDGSFSMRGELMASDAGSFTIKTQAGTFDIAANSVTCSGAGCPEVDTTEQFVSISGSETVASGLMPLLLAGYATHNDAAETIERDILGFTSEIVGDGGFGDHLANFRVRGTISSDAFANLIGRSSQVGLSSRRIRPSEVDLMQQIGAGDMTSPANEHIVALDNLVVITNPENSVQKISMEDLRGIYSGKISNWRQLGGDNAPITVVSLGAGSATKSTFDDRVFGGLAGSVPANLQSASTSAQVAALVNEDPHAIGYVSHAFQRGASPMTLVSDCGIEMTADAFSARTEEYALQRFMYMYTRADNQGPSPEAFVDYATSPAADAIVAKSGFIDLGISHREQSFDSQRAQVLLAGYADRGAQRAAQNMLADMANYDRLSSTFRFETGSDRLTPRGQVNMERLVEFIGELPAGTKLKFVGFTDSVGTFQNNRYLADNRAAQVMATLQREAGAAANGIEMSSVGYSEIAPVGCNADPAGRASNRRVEVWIESGVL